MSNPHLNEIEKAANQLLSELVKDALDSAITSGFTADEHATPRDEAVRMLRLGLPGAFVSEKWGKLLA